MEMVLKVGLITDLLPLILKNLLLTWEKDANTNWWFVQRAAEYKICYSENSE